MDDKLLKLWNNKYVRGFIKVVVTALILSFLLTLAHYFNLLSNMWLNLFKILIPLIALLYGGYHIGKRSKVRGWLEGIKLGLGVSILIVLFNVLGLNNGLNLRLFMYVVIILLVSILGSMLGITKTKETD